MLPLWKKVILTTTTKYYQLGISVFTSKYNRTDSRSSAHMVSKLTASGKHTFRAILGHKRTDRRYQLPTVQPTKPQSRKMAHRGEIQSHNFLSSVLNRCQTSGGNECLVSWEHVQKTASSKQTTPCYPSPPPPPQSQDRERAQGSQWWWLWLKGVPGSLPEASFLPRSFPFYTLQSPGLMGNFSMKFCLSDSVTHLKFQTVQKSWPCIALPSVPPRLLPQKPLLLLPTYHSKRGYDHPTVCVCVCIWI